MPKRGITTEQACRLIEEHFTTVVDIRLNSVGGEEGNIDEARRLFP